MGKAQAEGYIYGINGPVIKAKGSNEFRMLEVVYVGKEKLIGEVISVDDTETTIQVYEDTTGLTVGEPIVSYGSLMSVTLAPGIIGNIFDGIERPLNVIKEQTGVLITRGIQLSSVDLEKKWDAEFIVSVGDKVSFGTIIATVRETESIVNKVMIPFGVEGIVKSVLKNGQYNVAETIVTVETASGEEIAVNMMQEFPIRTPRPVMYRERMVRPLITGQRIIDALLPISKGGAAAIPGGFGTGKTMTQHQLAKWCDADIIVYIGCGERGNEMTQVLEEFSKLVDPKTGNLLLNRTVLIANTSNMPVAAREASIYTGVAIAEYYRDMGYHVAIMADSTSRWAEALREISGRLEEMPAEEGFPAYLASRLAAFYERAGYMHNLNGTEGSITIIGAVSPQGGDFSEPVTQSTKRFTRCFFSLDKNLAYARHYPAINWLDSYSEYIDELTPWFNENVSPDFMLERTKFMDILQEENSLMEIVKLIGSDILPDDQKLVLEIARIIRLGFLQQNAFHDVDTYVPLKKQMLMMKTISYLYEKAKELLKLNITIGQLRESGIYDDVIKMKYNIDNEDFEPFEKLNAKIENEVNRIKTDNGYTN